MRAKGTRSVGGLVAIAVTLLAACTTYVRPTSCRAGSSACGGLSDARFCEHVALAVAGADCSALGIAQEKHFCVVAPTCTDTSYAVKDRDCRVLRYTAVRDSAHDECPKGAPLFLNL